ncbi:hypothetical protein ACYT6H_09690, partial [Streptococcus pyogenes]
WVGKAVLAVQNLYSIKNFLSWIAQAISAALSSLSITHFSSKANLALPTFTQPSNLSFLKQCRSLHFKSIHYECETSIPG